MGLLPDITPWGKDPFITAKGDIGDASQRITTVPKWQTERAAICKACEMKPTCPRWALYPHCGGVGVSTALCPADPPRWIQNAEPLPRPTK